ncbi:MAG: DNA adenine methylase [Planctomycetes bacterium]|nr:DNA adenine methylase [Planctomycetota bacterium]
MGSKHRLLPWIAGHLRRLSFESALDAFSGSGCVSYLLKCLGKQVTSNDFLLFASALARATIENSRHKVSETTVRGLLRQRTGGDGFILRTFRGVFFQPGDLRFLDTVWANMDAASNEAEKAIVVSAMVRACLKRQPRGVFTVAGDPERYKDGRRDLRMSLEEHFIESIGVFNNLVFSNGCRNKALCGDVFDVPGQHDLVYLDPPYVPRTDDNCYVKRYHFLEGLASCWRAEGTEILHHTKVRKIPKRFTPFSYRRTALEGFGRLFERFRESILVLSYSSNGYPDLEVLVKLMRSFKRGVAIHERGHRYHFGTHAQVSSRRAVVREYLVIGE